MHELAYLHPLSGVAVPVPLCATCENQGGLGECLQVPRGLSASIAKRGGRLADGRPYPRWRMKKKTTEVSYAIPTDVLAVP